MHQAENDRLTDDCGPAAGELVQLAPEPSSEKQFFRQADAKAEQKRIQDVSAGELSKPPAP